MRKSRVVIAAALVVAIGLSGCSSPDAIHAPDVPSVPNATSVSDPQVATTLNALPPEYACPKDDSDEAKSRKQSPYTLESNTTEDILVAKGGALVRLAGNATTTGMVWICGGNATLLIESKQPALRAFVYGGGARLLIMDPNPDVALAEYYNPDLIILKGGGAGVIVCGKVRTDLQPCDSYLP